MSTRLLSFLRLTGAKLLSRGFGHIVLSNVVVKLFSFASSVVVVRVLSQQDFGVWSYAANILRFALLLSGLGAPVALVHFLSSTRETDEDSQYRRFALRFGVAFNLVLAVFMVCLGAILPEPISGTGRVLLWCSGVPLVHVIEQIQLSYLRARLKNRAFSALNLWHAAVVLVGSAIGAWLAGLVGIVLARYVASLSTAAIGIKLTNSAISPAFSTNSLPNASKLKFAGFAVTMVAANTVSQLVYVLDVFLVGAISGNAETVALYRIATLVPFNLLFIPSSVMLFAYPYLARHAHDHGYLRFRARQMVALLFATNVVIALPLFAFAPLFIRLLFGPEYVDAVQSFRLLLVSFVVSGSLKMPLGNLLAATGHHRANLLNAAICGSLNVVLDIWLISALGMEGAALASLIVLTVFSILAFARLFPILTKRT